MNVTRSRSRTSFVFTESAPRTIQSPSRDIRGGFVVPFQAVLLNVFCRQPVFLGIVDSNPLGLPQPPSCQPFSPLFMFLFTHFTYLTCVHPCSPLYTSFHLFSQIFTHFHQFSAVVTNLHLFSPALTRLYLFYLFSPASHDYNMFTPY